NPTRVRFPLLEPRGGKLDAGAVDEPPPGITPSIPRVGTVKDQLALQLRRVPTVIRVKERDPRGARMGHADVTQCRSVARVRLVHDCQPWLAKRFEPGHSVIR